MITVKISEVKPNPKNPRIIKDDKFRKLVKSIQEFPDMLNKRPLIVFTDTDGKFVVLGGNMRLKACKEIGLKEIPVILADEWTEEQKAEFLIKDNVGFGEWDWDQLANEWDAEKLDDWGLDLPVDLSVEKHEAEEDDFDTTPPEEPITVLGDLYEIGEHRLLCGDSTDSDQVAKLMNGEKAELLFTSPPYSDMREYNGKKDLSVDNIAEFIPNWMPFVEYQVVNLGIQRKDNDIVQYWDSYIDKARSCGYKLMAWNVWHKSSVSVGQQSAFIPIYHEWIFVFGTKFKDINRTWEREQKATSKNKRKVRQADGSMKESTIGKQEAMKEMESVFSSNVELGEIRSQHPAIFPIELPSEYIKAITNEGQIIAESFTGSGSTMVAAHQLKRKCFGMELDNKYCDVIIKRMLNLDNTLTVKRNGIDVTNDWK
jgi:DNA modification methylase